MMVFIDDSPVGNEQPQTQKVRITLSPSMVRETILILNIEDHPQYTLMHSSLL